ncbi:hypothetical protein D3C85_1800850 [compost metagenome]
MSKRRVFFSNQCSAIRFQLLFNNFVGCSREDVIGAEEEEFLAFVLQEPSDCGDDLLVRCCANVENIR